MAGKGKRYSDEGTLNYKKIFAVFIFIAVVIMFVFGIKKIIALGTSSTGKISSVNYFSVYSNEKWGVIDSNGNYIIKPQYDEMILIPDSSKAIFVCTYNVDYENGTCNTKVVNDKNEEIIKGYDSVEYIDYLDENGKITYLKDLLIVEKNSKYGIVDLSGKELLETEYDKISKLENISNSLVIEKDGLVGLSDYQGNIIIKPEYNEIQGIGNDYKNGYITKDKGNLYGIIDFNKSMIFDNKYLDIKSIYSSNKYAVKIDKNYRVVDKQGKILTDTEFEDILDILGEQIIYKEKNKYGVITINGEKIVEPEYEDLQFINNNFFIAQKNEKYGVISSNGDLEIDFKYEKMKYSKLAGVLIAKKENNQYDLFDSNMNLKLTANSVEMNDDYMKIQLTGETKYYNFKFEEKDIQTILINNSLYTKEKNGKYGFVDEKGNVVVDYKYDDATEFNKYGFAGVKINGVWGAINIKGEVVIEPKYNLDNNKEIDFMGKWHIGIGANYYTDM